MRFLNPTRHERLNEAAGIVLFLASLFLILSLASYNHQDTSWNTAGGPLRPHNLTGAAGAHVADLCLQVFGFAAYAIPVLIVLLAWRWVRSSAMESPVIKAAGSVLLLASSCTAFALLPFGRPIGGVIAAGGLLGVVTAGYLIQNMNVAGAAILTAAALVVSIYLVSTFTMRKLAVWFAGPLAWLQSRVEEFQQWRSRRIRVRAEKKAEKARLKAERRAAKEQERKRFDEESIAEPAISRRRARQPEEPPIVDPFAAPPWEDSTEHTVSETPGEEIPIRELEPYEPPDSYGAEEAEEAEPEPVGAPAPAREKRRPVSYRAPSTALLNEPAPRNPYDSQELKETAARIKSKLEEFNVRGSVVQINPGPVVTTFEFKPEAGIKYSRITTLTEDLCLGLEAESVLIERIPGKPTVGIEVPNSKREVISLRQIIESEEFQNSSSPMTIPLGKDINGRMKVAALDSMPHLLIAGSTGSGKSVMLNSIIMSILYKSTPDEVRLVMVDPKRLELGLYENIPHLLTPVITDPKQAANALRNAVGEMERRLKLLAGHGVRNIDQFNKKVRQILSEPRSLFEEELQDSEEDLKPLPFILVIIDELADLMMIERANVETSVARLAQMARAVGMHLILATQRPSVDVITGLIKANFPSRISFRVATRVDSRTVLDVMGAEHLLGKGDMLFLPPGSSRLIRVHGAYVTENEINRVVEFWKDQAQPDYDQTLLLPPPDEDDEGGAEEFDGERDPMYEDAVRVVCEIGKASTSTLQRRLRLGYGRAARILDMMQREGIIGPPDGSRPRDVLKHPDWLIEVGQLR
jgi:S-DNA-T family DNA segregation ATPase FtsK/SpoIIIE